MTPFRQTLFLLTAITVLAVWAHAQQAGDPPPVANTNPKATPPRQPSADQIRDQLLKARTRTPLIEPIQQPQDKQKGAPELAPAATVDVDPSILGFAPGERPTTVRRGGEFIINRRGRMMRVKNGGHLLFVFDADSRAAPETPIVLLPCGYLEYMEDVVRLRTDRVVFILSGQITLYHGVNYVLPTMVRLAEEQGNLQP